MSTVLQIIPHMGAGGAEQACVDIAAGLVAAGHRAVVVSNGGSRVAEILAVGGEHITMPVHTKNPIKIWKNALWLAGFIRDRKVNVVHARSRAPAWSAFAACRMTGCAFVTTNHAAYKFSNGIKKFYNSVMVRGDLVIAISDFIAAHIQKSYGTNLEKIRTIPRGVDLDKFARDKVTDDRSDFLRRNWGIGRDDKIILVPSRLSPIKGQGTVIEAMALLPPELHHYTAVILGHDQGRVGYRQHLADSIAASNLQHRVKLVEHCNDMPAAYSLASLVVAPSLVAEGFGRVPVESMVMGVPVIATELGGFSETIRNSITGWLVPPGDAKALADALIKALTIKDAERVALIQTAMQHARSLYSKTKMVADTLKVYAELVRR